MTLEADYVFSDEERHLLRTSPAGSLSIDMDSLSRRERRALRSLRIAAYEDLASLTVDQFLSVRAVGVVSLNALRLSIPHQLKSLVGLEASAERDAPATESKPAARTERTVRDLLPPGIRGALDDLVELLPRISARDVRFGASWVPGGTLLDLLDLEPSYAGVMQARHVAELTRGIERLHQIALEPQMLFAELSDLLPDESRDAQVGRMRWGLATGEPRTLDTTGKAFNLTRERVRQITSRLKHRRFEGRTAYLPTTQMVIHLLNDLGGAGGLSDWGELAYRRGLSETSRGPRAILDLGDTGLSGLPELIVGGPASDPIVALTNVDLVDYERIGPAVGRSLRRFGIVDIDLATDEIRDLGGEMEPDEVQGYVRRLSDLTTLNGGRFHVRLNDTRSPLWQGIHRMLSVAGALSVETLSRGLRRTRPGREMYGIDIPSGQLHEILDRSALVERRDGEYRWVGPDQDLGLAGAESALVQVFRDEGPVLISGRIREAMEERGYSLPTVTGLLRGSVLIERLERATYALVGSVIAASTALRGIQRRTPDYPFGRRCSA